MGTSTPGAAPAVAGALGERLERFLALLLQRLDWQRDRRLVRTVLATVRTFLRVRHRACGLLLSELGGYLVAPEHAPAGTKRLSDLLRSPKWSPQLIARFLRARAGERLGALETGGEDALVGWD